jgi:ABC-type multidrug transport system ATPase subunit
VKPSVVQKTVLDDVSGVANPGQLLSVMGPSGGGKTSVLNVLAGRINPAKGSVLLNGQKLPKNFNRIAAYVMQDDLLAEMLTPRELFNFAASLRLSAATAAERYSRVEYLIKTLGLSRCANNRVRHTRTHIKIQAGGAT